MGKEAGGATASSGLSSAWEQRRRWSELSSPTTVASGEVPLRYTATAASFPPSSISTGRTASSASAATSAAPMERPGGRGGEHRCRFIAARSRALGSSLNARLLQEFLQPPPMVPISISIQVAPFDCPDAIESSIRYWKPSLILLLESELCGQTSSGLTSEIGKYLSMKPQAICSIAMGAREAQLPQWGQSAVNNGQNWHLQIPSP